MISNFARTYTSGYLIRIATVTLNPSVPRLRPSPLHTSQHSRAFTPAHSHYNHWMHTAEHKNNQTTCQNIKQLRLARLATLNRHLSNAADKASQATCAQHTSTSRERAGLGGAPLGASAECVQACTMQQPALSVEPRAPGTRSQRSSAPGRCQPATCAIH